jgi:hypothetical protein
MPVDTSIYSNLLRPVKSVADYDAEAQALEQNALASQLKRQTIEGNALSMRQAQQKQFESDADTNALRTLAGGWNAQTTADQRIAGLRNSGRASLMTQADTLEKQAIERQRGEAEARSKQADVLSKVLTAQGELAGRVMAMPTRESAAAAIANMKAITQALGVPLDLSADEAAVGQFTSPDQIKQWAAGVALKAEQLLPKLQALNAGGQYVNQAVNPITGAVAETGRTDITESANNKANNARLAADAAAGRAVTMRWQNMTDARSRESNSAALSKPFEVTGPDGTPVLVQQTKDGKIQPVQGYAPKGGSAATEDERKAAGWLAQADNAWKNMREVAFGKDGKLREAARPGFNDALAGVPSFGFTEGAANMMRSKDRQKFLQGAGSLSEALLRAATGAGVNESEAKQKVRELTPVIGDDAEVIQQKMDAIPMYLESLRTRAGRAAPKGYVPPQVPSAVPPGTVLKFDAQGNPVQ